MVLTQAYAEQRQSATGLRRSTARAVFAIGAAIGFSLALGCGDDPQPPVKTTSAPKPAPAPAPTPTPAEPTVDTRTEAELIEAGRGAYNGNCIACHAMNPAIDGALGPAVADASFELLEARVMRGEYPEGYEPKRPSRVMIPLPHLETRLPEIAAYLQSFESL
jgi:mono/diheme cytochrome c family protein